MPPEARSPGPATVHGSVARHGLHGQARQRVALARGRLRRTYGTLAQGIEDAAGVLAARGVAAGSRPRAAILMEPGADFFEAFLGAGAAGMAAVVLQHGWSDGELRQALEAARPSVVLASPEHRDRLAPHLPAGALVAVGGAGVAGALAAWAGKPARPAGAPTPAAGADGASPFYVGFTSGTTGRPKGFVRDHSSWLRSFEASDAVFGIGVGDHVLVPGPLDHSLFLYAALHGLAAGATVHLVRRFAPGAVLRALAEQPITRVYLVPTMLAALLRAAQRASPPPRFHGVVSVISSGARWPAGMQERVAELFPAAEVLDFYGASELSFVSVRRPAATDPAGSVGRPFPGVEVSLRRADGSEAGPTESGRLWVRSDMLFSGYLEPGTRGAVRDARGWMTVGDVARRDEQGCLYLLGREDNMLSCGGVNVFPEEVEGVLEELPEVAEAIVTGLPDEYWGDLLCACVRWHEGRSLPRRRLREHCGARLAREKRPQRWLQVADFPRTGSGKVARPALARGLRDGTLRAQEFV